MGEINMVSSLGSCSSIDDLLDDIIIYLLNKSLFDTLQRTKNEDIANGKRV